MRHGVSDKLKSLSAMETRKSECSVVIVGLLRKGLSYRSSKHAMVTHISIYELLKPIALMEHLCLILYVVSKGRDIITFYFVRGS